MWRWEKFESFDLRLQELQDNEIEIPMTWVDCYGNQAKVSGEIAACDYDSFQRIRMRVLRYLKKMKADDGARLHGFLFGLCDNVGPYRGGSI